MISIVDYGMGNLRSVQKALERVGFTARVTDRPGDVSSCDLLVVPGVGAFDRAVENLHGSGLWDPILRYLKEGGAYLGICLGYQLLFETSEEGRREGFSVYAGRCERFRDVRPVPHMGWNEVEWTEQNADLRPDRSEDPCYYFVHSYYPVPEDSSLVAGRTDYGGSFASALRDGNRFGVQFHPEKSQYAGLDLLETIGWISGVRPDPAGTVSRNG